MEREDFTIKMKVFLKKRGIKQNDLAKQLGVTHPVVSNVINGRDKLGTPTALRWGEILGIDPLWLMTQGEQGTPPDALELPTVQSGQYSGVPIITDLVGYAATANAEGMVCQRMVVPGLDDPAAVVIQVKGDSMTDGTVNSIPDSSYVALKPSTLSTFRWGEVYALVTDDGVLVKKVMPGNDPEHIVCESYNYSKYPPYTLLSSEIKAVWRVCGVVMIRLL